MDLTQRKRQFLDKLMDLYQQTKLPVHYEALAAKLGVSKWTAYDMLKELEKRDYLNRDYAVNPGEAGRSQIVYFPTQKAYALFTQTEAFETTLDDWRDIKTEVKRFFLSIRGNSRSEAIRRILAELSRTKVRMKLCAYTIVLLLFHLEGLGKQTDAMIKSMYRSASNDEMKLTVFVAAILGTIIQNTNEEISVELTELAASYLDYIGALSKREKSMLVSFLNELQLE